MSQKGNLVSPTKDRSLTGEESMGAQNERFNLSEIGAEREYEKITPSTGPKGKTRVESYKRSFAPGERAKGAKDQRFNCQTPEFSGELGRFGRSLHGRGKTYMKGSMARLLAQRL
jgi:hypothetical protein